RMLDMLDDAGELDNTLVIVTSDNGMSFPRAKANLYEDGIHMPLAIAWPAAVPGGRESDDLVNLIDLTATIYEATGVKPPEEPAIAGSSLMRLLMSDRSGIIEPAREAIFSGRERHSSSRFNSLGYPQRCIRTQQFLYIRNFRPQRWPAGAPQKFNQVVYGDGDEIIESTLGPEHGGYHDIDGCPTLSFLIERRDDPEIARFLHLAVDRRPAEELFDVRSDPGCLKNLAADPAHARLKQELSERLLSYLRETQDARVVTPDGGDVWETYPRYSPLRWFPKPDWAREHPELVPEQPWLEAQRPRSR
ncbi:MAG: sulfatase-like hydrolase/transferase, partial [Planctomycetes bacterium]|nr:sulfatase-like hydrolase/transferase [Planctomycetota bacterium]